MEFTNEELLIIRTAVAELKEKLGTHNPITVTNCEKILEKIAKNYNSRQ